MKPQNFPLKPSLDGSEELYTQTKGVSQKFTLEEAKEFIVNGNDSYKIEPSSVELTNTPNNFKGWKVSNSESSISQSVEIDSIQKIKPIESIVFDSKGGSTYIVLGNISEGEEVKIYAGDTITISGSLNNTNNQVWKVINFFSNLIVVEETNEKRLTAEEISSATLTYNERVILQLDWVQAQLEDGTLIWEAYEPISNREIIIEPEPLDEIFIDGYWIAMRPNSTSGEYEYVSHLKMTENFWQYWYNYTVKIDNEPNSIILTTLTQKTSYDTNIGSANFKLSLIDDELVIEETIYDLEKTWTELYIELTGEITGENPLFIQYVNPYYNSDNDWYGMMKGEQMGWYWAYQTSLPYFVGFNMLNGQTQLIDISESFLNIKNVFFNLFESTEETLLSALKTISNIISHPKYGLLFTLDSTLYPNSFTALWSPNFVNIEYATIMDFYGFFGNKIYVDGGLSEVLLGSYIISFNNDYVIYGELSNNNAMFIRKKLDDLDAKTENYSLPFDYSNFYQSESIYTWERDNSLIISFPIYTGAKFIVNQEFYIWRNDNNSPKLIKTPMMYPYMLEDNKLTSWDRVWDYNNITTMTINFKNKVI